jgi:hypothetical protein
MKWRKAGIVLATIVVVALCFLGLGLHRRSVACSRRQAALTTRFERLKHDAREKLQIGATQEDVLRFFAGNGLHSTIAGEDAYGQVSTSGCSPFGCGSDAFLIVVKVKLDEEGKVESEPDIRGIYTDCL